MLEQKERAHRDLIQRAEQRNRMIMNTSKASDLKNFAVAEL